MHDVLKRLDDENEIKKLVIKFLFGVDVRSYDQFRASWADEVELYFVGFPSMAGFPPSGGDTSVLPGKVAADDYARAVIDMISEFTATQHIIGNHLVSVDGDQATSACYVIASHYLATGEGEPWSTIGVRYEPEARRFEDGWRITKFTWTHMWSTGNSGLWAEVGRRFSLRNNSR